MRKRRTRLAADRLMVDSMRYDSDASATTAAGRSALGYAGPHRRPCYAPVPGPDRIYRKCSAGRTCQRLPSRPSLAVSPASALVGRPVGQPLARSCSTTAAGALRTKVSPASLPLALADLDFDARDFLRQAHALGVEIDQAGERNVQLELAERKHRGRRQCFGVAESSHADRFKAGEEFQLARRIAPRARDRSRLRPAAATQPATKARH